ncbi:MAG: intradiol ring-cleavage dioxygenase [Steroidobacteraceae bacterium]
MHLDDETIGRLLSRREALLLLGSTGLTLTGTSNLFAADSLPTCVVKPEMTAGPYFVDQQLNRSDIRSEPSDGSIKPGVPLSVAFNVFQLNNGCKPLADAIVDFWQCDTQGIYSGVDDATLGFHTVGKKFLRGYQTTNAQGKAQFATIFPGWYPERTVHLHFKIRTKGTDGNAYEFTSQLYFEEALINKIHAGKLYVQNRKRDTTNDTDIHFRNGGTQLLLNPKEAKDGSLAATFDIGLDLTDTNAGAADGMRGPGGPGGGGMGGGPGGPGMGGRPPGA